MPLRSLDVRAGHWGFIASYRRLSVTTQSVAGFGSITRVSLVNLSGRGRTCLRDKGEMMNAERAQGKAVNTSRDTAADGSTFGSTPLRLLDKALELQAPLARKHVARIRARHPDDGPKEVVRRLNAEFRSATISAGAGVGAAAAAPGVGTGVALAISGGESVAFLNATVLYILARSEVQGIPVHDVERRRTLVMAIMLGEAGAASVQRVAERTGQHWARRVVTSIPQSRILAVNRVLGQNFVTKYGTKQGILVLGKIIPFGIGTVIGAVIGANATLSHGVIKASDRAFGERPADWHGSDSAPN